MSVINREIGVKLKHFRDLNGYSLSDVRLKVGKSKSAIHAYEQGKVSISIDTLVELCNVYGINYVDLLRDVNI